MRNWVIIIFLGLFGLSLQAQDPIFSQFYAAPLQINPAFAGNTNAPHITANYRNQFTNLDNYQAFRTYAVSYSQFFKPVNSGFGLQIMSDDIAEGLLSTNSITAAYTYRVQVNKDLFFKIGAEAGAFQTRLDWDRLIFLDQIDPTFGPSDENGIPNPTQENRPDDLNRLSLDLGAGFLAYNRVFYAGFSLKHLNTPNQSFLLINDNLNTGLPMRMTLHSGAQIILKEGNKRQGPTFISPNIMVIKQGDFGQVNAGTYAGLGSFFAGVWYRHAWSNSDAAIFLVGVQKDIYKIGYSFDLPLQTNLGIGTTGGTHELSVVISFEKPGKKDLNDCFQLFR